MDAPTDRSLSGYAHDQILAPAALERRAWAAGCDVTILSVCGLGLFLAFGPVTLLRDARVWVPCAVILGLVVTVELLTGVTPGKWLAGLSVRRPDGSRPAVGALIVRGMVRLLPVWIFAASLVVRDELASGVLCVVAACAGICYIPATYIQVMRTGRTPFDAVGGTAVVPAARG
jgi:uncharacterized RDD family membrane protein YckC